jgi:hypothetical protein
MPKAYIKYLAQERLTVSVYVIQQTVVGIIQELAFLLFLHALNQEAQLLANLVVWTVEKIGDPGVNIDNSVDAAQAVFPWFFFILDESGREDGLVFVPAGRLDDLGLIHPVPP